jgi:hypothetical protein
MACSAIRLATENDDRESARNADFGGWQALVEQARTVALESGSYLCAEPARQGSARSTQVWRADDARARAKPEYELGAPGWKERRSCSS